MTGSDTTTNMVTVYYVTIFKDVGVEHKLQIKNAKVEESDLQYPGTPIKKSNMFYLVDSSKLNSIDNCSLILVDKSGEDVWQTFSKEHGENGEQKLVFLKYHRIEQELARLDIACVLPQCRSRKTYHWNGLVHEKWRVDLKGKRTGKYEKFSASGKLDILAYYHEDQLHGKYVEFWENGKIKSDIAYGMGRFHGQYKEFLKDGVLLKSLQYDKGHLVGKAQVGTEFDRCVDYSEYERTCLGKLHGKQVIRSRTETGELLEEVQHWNNGLKVNEWTTTLSGKMVKKIFHCSDKYVVRTYGLDGYEKYECYDTDGKVLQCMEEARPGQRNVIRFKRTKGDVEIFNESGQLIKTESTVLSSTYVKEYDPSTGKLLKRFCRASGLLHEGYCVFNTKGKLIFSLNFLHGRRHGKFMMRKSDGSFLCQGKYCHGLLHGSYREALANGEEVLGHYEHGIKTGNWTTVKDGKLVSLQEMRHGTIHRGYTIAQ